MSDIWGVGEHIQCVHPGSACIAGRTSVLESWKLVLGTGRMSISTHDVRIFATESEGFVTCVERLEIAEGKG
jgi:translation initiation factor 2A